MSHNGSWPVGLEVGFAVGAGVAHGCLCVGAHLLQDFAQVPSIKAGFRWHSPAEAQDAHPALQSTQVGSVVCTGVDAHLLQDLAQLASMKEGFRWHSPPEAQDAQLASLSTHGVLGATNSHGGNGFAQ